jgi:hypothetical protein
MMLSAAHQVASERILQTSKMHDTGVFFPPRYLFRMP